MLIQTLGGCELGHPGVFNLKNSAKTFSSPLYNHFNQPLEGLSRWFLDLFDALNPAAAFILSQHCWL